jgi:hypothetical protein
MKKNQIRKIAWGVFLICAAGLIIANALYGFTEFSTLLLTIGVVLVAIPIIESCSITGIFIPLAVLGIIFNEQLGIERLTPLPILAAAVLLTVGFSVIFHKKNKSHRFGAFNFEDLENFESGFESGFESESETSSTVKFGSCTKYVASENLEKAHFKCDFGALAAYFTESKLSPNGATLYISANFSGVELYVPKHWNVQNNLTVVLGGVEEKGKNIPAIDSPVFTIVGSVNLSGVEIHYV